LEDAKGINPRGDSIPSGEGTYWRGKLSSVDGPGIGSLLQALHSEGIP